MAKVTFVLKEKEAGKETPIVCYIRYKGQRLKYYTSELIHPKHWEDRKQSKNYQRAKGSLAEAPELNRRLDEIERTVKNVFRQFQNDHSNAIPGPEQLKQLLDVEFKRVATTKKEFLDFFQEIIDSSKSGTRVHPQTGKPISPNTVKTYVTTLAHIKSFAEKARRKVTFETVTLDFYSDYTEYLIKTLKLGVNSVGRDIKIIKNDIE
ncbi:phage integrase SAM-like domain-containing protein [Puia sp. P3]|uniref:phage integrase SAM-like domain-containing protein n=1 Tax=Puia sp. P3 TaxID=3423952 RepID=UPI003D677EE3